VVRIALPVEAVEAAEADHGILAVQAVDCSSFLYGGRLYTSSEKISALPPGRGLFFLSEPVAVLLLF
jgi:hypothetical protein